MLQINKELHRIRVALPLTTTSGKIRVKRRSMLNEYGIPVPTRSTNFTQSDYIEWQIGYDVPVKDVTKIALTSLPEPVFIGANNKEKALYELSEYVKYFYDWGVVERRQLEEILNYLNNIDEAELLENNPENTITRSHAINKRINGFNFEYTQVRYPLLIYKFMDYEIATEIKTTEKQRAIGVQPMLYFCIPVTKLKTEIPLVGRKAFIKEFGFFDIDRENISVFIELLKIFGILSASHRHDVIRIIESIIR